MASVHDVAAFLRAQAGPLDPLRLQKLVYYSQAWSLAWDHRPLFGEAIEAWRWGPVAPSLWRRLNAGVQGNPTALSQTEQETVFAVLNFYGRLTGPQLVDLSHRDALWRNARQGLSRTAGSNRPITPQAMLDYYGPAVQGTEKRIPEEVQRGIELLLATPDDQIDGLLEDDRVGGETVLRWLETGEDDPPRALEPGRHPPRQRGASGNGCVPEPGR